MRLGLILLLIPFFSLAKVEHSSPAGFKITLEKNVQVSQAQAYQQFLRVNQW